MVALLLVPKSKRVGKRLPGQSIILKSMETLTSSSFLNIMSMPDLPESSQSPQTGQSPQTNPSTATAVSSPPGSEADQSPPGNPVLRFIGNLFTLIFRVGLLTGGAGIALVAGVAIATIRPAEVNEPPLFETIMQQADRFRP